LKAREQIHMFRRTGCTHLINEIEEQGGKPLSKSRLNDCLRTSVNEGFVFRAQALAELLGSSLNSVQLTRLIRQCIKLGWLPDALYAYEQGQVSKIVSHELALALLKNGLASNWKEVKELLECS
jgi:hypothetical protein